MMALVVAALVIVLIAAVFALVGTGLLVWGMIRDWKEW